MEFGMFCACHIRSDMMQADAFQESFNQVEMAEKLGLDAVWLAEHHFMPDRSVLAAPLVVASAIAARTSRIKIGLAVLILPLANPIRIAEEAATVDHISKGRFEFGIGRAHPAFGAYRAYNVDYSESRQRLLEALDIIINSWKEEGKFSYQGQYYSFQDIVVVPKPYQKPHPPIRIAVSGRDTFAMAGKMGLPIFIEGNAPIPQIREYLDEFRSARREAGHPGDGDVVLRIPSYLADTAERARNEPEASSYAGIQYVANMQLAYATTEEDRERIRRNARTPYEQLLPHRVMYGTPEAVTERIQEYQEELGVTGIALETNFGGQIPHEGVVTSIRLFTEKVLPHFK
jgi:alkanesulfonate monooxygenase SsuD/methylene tetrahydromethanopterin reductase-like flavin-dependent oxidoreductase (luciferase family)